MAIAEIKQKPINGDFNLKHLQEIHRHVFIDIYEWAGELRTVNISNGNSPVMRTYKKVHSNNI